MFKSKGSKGSIVVDAACSLPIFIIAFGILLLLIAQAGIEDTVGSAMAQASGDVVCALAAQDGESDAAEDVIAYTAFTLGLKSNLSEEWSGNSPEVKTRELCSGFTYYLAGGTRLDSLLHVNVGMKSSVPFGASYAAGKTVGKGLVFRQWTGESAQNSSSYDDSHVYIFPKRGEHYHCASCSCLKNGELQVVLTDALRKKYNGCPTCHAGELLNGAPVFLMSKGSTAYHRKSCPCITKAYERVTLSDAKAMGYTACSLCGGVGSGYSEQNDFFK